MNDLPGPYLRVFNPAGGSGYRHLGVETAAVLYYNGGRQVVVWPGGRGERPPFLKRLFAVCEVALGHHRSSFDMELPARGGASFFQTQVDVLWEVEDPLLVAQAQLRDVRMLHPALVQLLQDITMRFPINQAEAAYAAVKSALESGLGRRVGAPVGLVTTVFVRLRLNEATINHAAAVAEVEHDRVVDEHRQRLVRQQKDFEDAQLAKRAGRYVQLLAQGELAQVAMLVAQDGANMPQVISAMMSERRQDHTETLEFVKHLIDRGYLQPHQLDEQTRALLEWTVRGGDPGRLHGGPPMEIERPPRRRALERPRSDQDERDARGSGGARATSEPWEDEPDTPPAHAGRAGDRGQSGTAAGEEDRYEQPPPSHHGAEPSRPGGYDTQPPRGYGGRHEDPDDRRDDYRPPPPEPVPPTYEPYGYQDSSDRDRRGNGAARSGSWSASHDWEQ